MCHSVGNDGSQLVKVLLAIWGQRCQVEPQSSLNAMGFVDAVVIAFAIRLFKHVYKMIWLHNIIDSTNEAA